jgi:hypothetical protein
MISDGSCHVEIEQAGGNRQEAAAVALGASLIASVAAYGYDVTRCPHKSSYGAQARQEAGAFYV